MRSPENWFWLFENLMLKFSLVSYGKQNWVGSIKLHRTEWIYNIPNGWNEDALIP